MNINQINIYFSKRRSGSILFIGMSWQFIFAHAYSDHICESEIGDNKKEDIIGVGAKIFAAPGKVWTLHSHKFC